MDAVRRALAGMPVVLRYVVVGAAALGIVGVVTGTAIGLQAYPPTAWAAAFEVGIPATLLGALLGLVTGLLALLIGNGTRGHAG